jgi:hypothetical protein
MPLGTSLTINLFNDPGAARPGPRDLLKSAMGSVTHTMEELFP